MRTLRGTLSHWVVMNNGNIKNYQAVVPSTWNASPRDSAGASGSYEASLLRTPIADPEKSLEVLRTIHSFHPCIACACHTYFAVRPSLTSACDLNHCRFLQIHQ
jgi:Ni,Fe-hydrogenase I large subunit